MPGLINMKPKVGIRRAIDGRLRDRRNVAQTVAMAAETANFLRSNVRYHDGSPLEVVVSSNVIGNAEEAARTADEFHKKGVGVEITTTPFWCYGSETISMHPTNPKAIFGKNGTERPGAVYLAAAAAGHDQSGINVFKIYGSEVQDANDSSVPDDVKRQLLGFVKAGLAVSTMFGKSYLAVGGTSMGIAGSRMTHSFFEDSLGMRVEEVDMHEVRGRIDQNLFDQHEYKRALEWVQKNCPEGKDYNAKGDRRSRKHKNQEWETSIKMALIVRDLMVGNPSIERLKHIPKSLATEKSMGKNAIAAGFQGQRGWTDYMPNGDFLEAILNTSFDWNGRRSPYIVATENDSLNGATMLMGYLLTNTAQIFADVRTYWSQDAIERATGQKLERFEAGLLHLINSGPAALDGTGRQMKDGKPAMKPYWEISPAEVKECLGATTWHPSDNTYFPGGGMSTRFLTLGEMPVTMTRINIVKGIGPVMQIAEGYTANLPSEVHDKLDNRTNPTWPSTWFALKDYKFEHGKVFSSAYTAMKEWGANHGAFSYGHIGADLITLASMLRIPVAMHNVEDERIFRPSAWTHFGTKNKESADLAACNAFGPLYGKLKR